MKNTSISVPIATLASKMPGAHATSFASRKGMPTFATYTSIIGTSAR
jgi:hypothetical protein